VIPHVVPPLTALRVLVTRPQPQATSLAAGIEAMGGEAIVFPALAVEPIAAAPQQAHDLIVFASVHAVEFGAKLIERTSTMRVAAIGKATAAALAAADLPADIVPAAAFTSEALLAHPDLKLVAGQRVLIVRGQGGREALREAFTSQGLSVTACEVYRRIKPSIDPAAIAALESRWLEEGIDIVTATSVETFTNLSEILSERGRAVLRTTPLLAPSRRIIDAALASGWNAEAFISYGADDLSLLGTLANWRTRARSNEAATG